MGYQKTQWKDHIEGVQVGTPVNAVNMNKIEEGIAQAHLISQLDRLWVGNLKANDTTISLSNPITNYRLLMVIGTSSQYSHFAVSNILPASSAPAAGDQAFVVSSDPNVGIARLVLDPNTSIQFQFTSTTSLKSLSGFSATARLTAVIGIR